MHKDDNLFDRRVVAKNISEAAISPVDYEKRLKSLPDAADKADYTPVEKLAPRSYLRGAIGTLAAPGTNPETEKPAG